MVDLDTDILIIGAGMSGLGLAVQLIRNYGYRDFQIVEISGPPANKAFQTGAVDAYYSIDPNMADLVEQTGGRIISTGADVDVENLYPYVATTDALENKQEAIGKVIQAVADNMAV